MCFSQRFIFALMPLCSALYWCFCHIVKIYGAISLPWNGLIEVSGLVDLWPNMAQRGKKGERRSGKLINLYLYSDWWRSMSLYKIGKRDNTQTADNVLNIFPVTLDKIMTQFCNVRDERFHFPLAWTISSDISAHDCTWKHSEERLIYGWRLQSFYLLYANTFSCCIQRHASCSNLLSVFLVKLPSKLHSLIETRSLWLWQSLNHSCYVVLLPPAGPFGHVPRGCEIATRCRY